MMMDEGVHVNGIEYPVVALGEARLRLNLMPQHTRENLDLMVVTFDKLFKLATLYVDKGMEDLQKELEKPKL